MYYLIRFGLNEYSVRLAGTASISHKITQEMANEICNRHAVVVLEFWNTTTFSEVFKKL